MKSKNESLQKKTSANMSIAEMQTDGTCLSIFVFQFLFFNLAVASAEHYKFSYDENHQLLFMN